MPFHKIVVMGDRNVGKTAMSMMYVYGRFPPEYRPTSEDVYIKSLEVGDNYHIKNEPILFEII